MGIPINIMLAARQEKIPTLNFSIQGIDPGIILFPEDFDFEEYFQGWESNKNISFDDAVLYSV